MTRYSSPALAAVVLAVAWVAFLHVGFRVPLRDIFVQPALNAAQWIRNVL